MIFQLYVIKPLDDVIKRAPGKPQHAKENPTYVVHLRTTDPDFKSVLQ